MKNDYVSIVPVCIISDLDDTLLDRKGMIIPDVANAIQHIMNTGILFSFATSRDSMDLAKAIGSLRTNMPLVLCNGAVVLEQESFKAITACPIEKDISRKISIIFKSYALTEQIVYINEDKEFLRGVADSVNAETNEVISLSVIDGQKRIFEIRNSLIELKNSDIQINVYNIAEDKEKLILDITSAYANKGAALKYIKEHFLNSNTKIIGFGNGLNDVSLLHESDYGIAVGELCESDLLYAAKEHINYDEGYSVIQAIERLTRKNGICF